MLFLSSSTVAVKKIKVSIRDIFLANTRSAPNKSDERKLPEGVLHDARNPFIGRENIFLCLTGGEVGERGGLK